MERAGFIAAISAAALGWSFVHSAVAANAHWRFDIVNKSKVAAVEFRTQSNGAWSPNWIGDRIDPDDRFHMDFGADIANDCTVRTEIRFNDGSFFDADVDYCKVTTLYIYDNKLTWE
jgi:hypothetical protein